MFKHYSALETIVTLKRVLLFSSIEQPVFAKPKRTTK